MATMQPLSLRGILENDSIDAEDLLADDDVLFNDDHEYNQSGIMIEIPDSGSASVLPTITEEDDAPLFSDDDDEIPSVPRRIVPISSTMSDSESEDEVFEEIPVPESNVVGEVEVLEDATQESIDRDEIFEAIPTKADSSLSSTVEPAVINLNKDDEALFSDSDEDFHPNTKRSKTQQKPSVQPIEVIDEWEDVIVNERDTVKPKVMIQETNGNTHVSDEMSANDIWKMFQESGTLNQHRGWTC
ncbi:hypothetical protein BCR33DRAFT_582229 [Rhizoclosmatium globosum]|uniref:Uncharacterized protein n=1 Tax=Rhizoclosmatium globosum TaxID=329046 RepID=A0A1Y2CR43_9FUNG|nr:hypothetical protein BCR33DRAFT_582229 [Rhizoclosmatium globosum]|eukprot:ORY49416.1 hypothetical protein BCR33DRAFT_582229 [Rhizoclosmatium globosum]